MEIQEQKNTPKQIDLDIEDFDSQIKDKFKIVFRQINVKQGRKIYIGIPIQYETTQDERTIAELYDMNKQTLIKTVDVSRFLSCTISTVYSEKYNRLILSTEDRYTILEAQNLKVLKSFQIEKFLKSVDFLEGKYGIELKFQHRSLLVSLKNYRIIKEVFHYGPNYDFEAFAYKWEQITLERQRAQQALQESINQYQQEQQEQQEQGQNI